MSQSKTFNLTIIGLVLISLWTFGIYHYAYRRGNSTNTPEHAIRQAIQSHQWTNSYSILPDKAAVDGGYFMAVQTSSTAGQGYEVFYTSIQNGRWTATDLHCYLLKSASPPEAVAESQHAADMIIASTMPDRQVAAVVGYQIVGGEDKEIPFSLVEIGRLPIWAYKFSSKTNIENKLVGYDKQGNIVSRYGS